MHFLFSIGVHLRKLFCQIWRLQVPVTSHQLVLGQIFIHYLKYMYTRDETDFNFTKSCFRGEFVLIILMQAEQTIEYSL